MESYERVVVVVVVIVVAKKCGSRREGAVKIQADALWYLRA